MSPSPSTCSAASPCRAGRPRLEGLAAVTATPRLGHVRDTVVQVLELAQVDASARRAARADVPITPRFGPGTWRAMRLGPLFFATGPGSGALPTWARSPGHVSAGVTRRQYRRRPITTPDGTPPVTSMDWQSHCGVGCYAVRVVQPGSRVFVGSACATRRLLEALEATAPVGVG